VRILTLSFLALFLLSGIAQADPAAVGIYFDTAATQTSLARDYAPGTTITAYIFATHTEQTVGGAAFKLVMDPRITLVDASYPAGIQVGTLADGIQIGLTNCEMGFYGRPVRLATLTLSTGQNWMFDAALRVTPYPPAGVVQLADCQGTITEVAGGTAALTVYPATRIGVFFDTEAVHDIWWALPTSQPEVVTAYVLAVESEQLVGGCAYQLELDPHITLLGSTYPPGVCLGDPLSGVRLSFNECLDGRGGSVVLVSTLSLQWTPRLWDQLAIRILPHPQVGAVQIIDCAGAARAVEGGRALLMTPEIAVEKATWGAVKSLYGR
jgi:hypothetical protein